MTDKVHFKLAYNGVTYRFASTLQDDSLFRAVVEHISKIVVEKNFEMFWRDEDSDVILETSDDLSTAVEYAKCTRKSPTDTPCVYLTVGATKTTETEEPQQNCTEDAFAAAVESAADAEDEAETAIDLLPQVKEQLLSLFDSALSQQWTAPLRTAMQPLFCPDSQQLLKPSKTCAAEIAVQLEELKKQIPAELKEQLQQLSGKELRELVKTDWLEEEVKKRITEEAAELVKDAVTAVKLAVELSVYVPYIVEDDEDDEEEEDESSDEEDEAVEENKKQEEDWATQHANYVLNLAHDQFNLVRTHLAFPSPLEYLEEAAAPAAESAATTVEVAAPMDRVSRIREFLRLLPDMVVEGQETLRKIEKHSTTLMSMDFFEKIDRDEDIEDQQSMEERLASILRDTAKELPEDLLRQLEVLQPDQLARVVLLDWMDRIYEENRNKEQTITSSASTLHDLLYFAAAGSIYPNELLKAVELTNKKDEEKLEKNRVEKEKEMSEEELIQREQCRTRFAISTALAPLMPFGDSNAFMKYMIPPPPPFVLPDPALQHPQWAAFIQQLEMSEQMKEYCSLQQLQSVQEEIAAFIHRYVRNFSEKRLKGVEEMPHFLSTWPLYEWLKRMTKKEKVAKRGLSKDSTRNQQAQERKEFPPAKLAALLFMSAAESKGLGPNDMPKRLAKLNIRRSAEMGGSEEARAFTTLRSVEKSTVVIPPARTPTHEMVAWIDRHAAAILKKGLEHLVPVMALLMKPATVVEQHAQPEEVQLMQPVEKAADKICDFTARERELKIREKELQMKEEVFERQVATFELKMDEYKEKMSKLKNRVEDIEEKDVDDYLKSIMDEMEGKLKKIEEKVNEDDKLM